MPPVIEACNAEKTFSQHKRLPGLAGALKGLFTRDQVKTLAVNDISFAIGKGEAVGYLGPNGAGKSTMIKMLVGILAPSGGRVRVLDKEPLRARKENAARIGVVFGQRSQLWWDLPVADSLELHKRIYRIEPKRYRENVAWFSEMLQLKPLLEKPVRQLSLGQRMRVEIVMALLHDPEILFLDEPTIGLDIMAKDAIRRFLRAINQERQVTMILTTHDLQDIERICPRIILIDEGKLLFDGRLADLKAKLGSQRRLKIEFSEDPGMVDLPQAELLSDEGRIKHFLFAREVSPVDALIGLRDRHSIKDISIEEPDIEEVIKIFYKNLDTQNRETAAF